MNPIALTFTHSKLGLFALGAEGMVWHGSTAICQSLPSALGACSFSHSAITPDGATSIEIERPSEAFAKVKPLSAIFRSLEGYFPDYVCRGFNSGLLTTRAMFNFFLTVRSTLVLSCRLFTGSPASKWVSFRVGHGFWVTSKLKWIAYSN